MGFVSGNGMFEGASGGNNEKTEEDKDIEEIGKKVENVTKKVAEAVFQGHPVH